MNLHVITPSDLLKFQKEHYSELEPRFEGQERFLNNEINKLYGKRSSDSIITVRYRCCNSCNKMYNILQKKLERI